VPYHDVAARRSREFTYAAVARQARDLAAGRVDGEQRRLPQVAGGGQQRAAVTRHLEVRDGAVPLRGDVAHHAAVPQLDGEPVGFETGTFHGQPGEIAVLEEHRLRVPGRVVGGEILRRRAAIYGHLVEIEVGRPGFLAPGDACVEHQQLAVGRERVFLVTTHGLRRDVRVEFAAHVDR
jgi:hypothetical protein